MRKDRGDKNDSTGRRVSQRHSPQKSARTAKSRQETDGKRVTLPRALSKLGYCSRTQAEVLIAAGRVTVDGRRITDPSSWIDLDRALIAVDGTEISAEKQAYFMLNKPRGLVTTRDDPEGRPTVYDCLRDLDARHLSPVGRLDKASEGLLLFTNDTVLAQALLDPITHVGKKYHVQVNRIMEQDLLDRMERGIVDDGELLTATSARLLRSGERNGWIEVELKEGRNRQIRRMLEALDVECLRLVRVSFGGLALGDLPKGTVRALTDAEVLELRRRAGMEKGGRNGTRAGRNATS
ncbi:MAG: rRNA pseudouridine synthase [Rhizobiaceae bacterium]|nr:rRNA pseudouridine synthase [Rhizobiaceae bacterium]